MMSYTIPRNTGRLQQQKRKKVIHSRIQWIDEIDQIRIFGRWWRRRGRSVVEIRGFVVEKEFSTKMHSRPPSPSVPLRPFFSSARNLSGRWRLRPRSIMCWWICTVCRRWGTTWRSMTHLYNSHSTWWASTQYCVGARWSDYNIGKRVKIYIIHGYKMVNYFNASK